MIEKIPTRVLDSAAITRQAGRGRLVVVKGPDRGETIAIAEASLTVGSGGGCDVLLSDPTISRRHLGIDPGPTGLVLRDLGSTNGSFVQGSRFNELTLAFGTEVTIGKTVLKYLPTEEEVDLAPSDKESYGSLVGRDPKLRRLFRVLDDVAATEATVLIEGETGTGKELLAEEIHRHSPRKDGPFIVFDCGAVPDELIESALFGHVRGAFTGAITDRPGAFEEADGGTLFLDEIGELAPGVQPALLRALDKQSVRPVGGSTYTRASVRVVAATNRNLRAEIAARRFREDLYYRVAVVRMVVPPLRERPDDIPLLVQHFMRQFRGDRALEVAPEDMVKLRRHDWLGNVRELRNVIERACAVSHGARLELDDALDDRPAADPGPAGPVAVNVDLPFKEAKARVVEAFERDYIRALLERHNGNLSAASRAAEIDRKHLRELLRKHGLRESSESCRWEPPGGSPSCGRARRASAARSRAACRAASPTRATPPSICASCCAATAPSARFDRWRGVTRRRTRRRPASRPS